MDSNKNIIAAISLSAAIIVLWALFFSPSPEDREKIKQKRIDSVKSLDAPEIENSESNKLLSRTEALNKDKRIIFENDNVKGSISLKGAIIDDLLFKNYNEKLEGTKKVVLLNPRNASDTYYLETGWVTNNKNIGLPDNKSKWKVEGNTKLSPGNDVKLKWKNDQGLTFEKIISIDNKFLFTINQKIKNNTNKIYNFYPYSQIIRKNIPKDIVNFFILHEGPLGVFDDQLVEKDYDDVIDKKYSINAEEGFLGITDKYWLTSLIPEKNKNFRADFEYSEKFKISYIETEPLEAEPNKQISNKVDIVIAAKEVDVIDEYNEKLGLSKFDLVIDWGWFYWIVKPLFFLNDYFFKLAGNYGLAIILITVCLRLLFFPLNNYAFRSMSRMKILQPEMARLKEVHKDDKMKLQQAIMQLYKKEGVNPVSGCVPILISIPFFFAIYKMLFVTIEMRHQPFFGWIKDLSEKDPTSIFNLFGLIPWSPPDFLIIGALPVLMGLTMWAQQKLNPAPQDDIQKKIFMFFPVFLTVILAPFPSGLVLYWTANNILTMAQQYVIMKRTTVKTSQ
ncbi:membrane protein insertase YidC [Candidatus Pelagibacter communis]|uniref:membrane protein insertase YidC n=1 Tax=Pelagibacter ubique TaxID=198252 RepID=UPI00094C199B|nr:membrane protein insertase YidC [Candidatus Pelagibacter ubique]